MRSGDFLSAWGEAGERRSRLEGGAGWRATRPEEEEDREDPEEKVLDYLASKNFPHAPRAIERAHRIGPRHDGKTRPIIVKFNNFKDLCS